MNQARPIRRVEAQGVEHAVEMAVRPRPALHRQARRLVEDQRLQILVDHHLAREGDLVLAQRRPFALRLGDDARERFGDVELARHRLQFVLHGLSERVAGLGRGVERGHRVPEGREPEGLGRGDEQAAARGQEVRDERRGARRARHV